MYIAFENIRSVETINVCIPSLSFAKSNQILEVMLKDLVHGKLWDRHEKKIELCHNFLFCVRKCVLQRKHVEMSA